MVRTPSTTPSDDEGPVGREQTKRTKRTPELEVALGARIRAARIAARMSQTTLGNIIGISFQQVQKYELGKDRVAASTLQCFAAALGVHPGSFFDEDMVLPSSPILDMKRAFKAADVLGQIRDQRVLAQLLALAKVLATAETAKAVAEDEQPAIAPDEDR